MSQNNTNVPTGKKCGAVQHKYPYWYKILSKIEIFRTKTWIWHLSGDIATYIRRCPRDVDPCYVLGMTINSSVVVQGMTVKLQPCLRFRGVWMRLCQVERHPPAGQDEVGLLSCRGSHFWVCTSRETRRKATWLSLEGFCRWDPSQSDVIVARGILSLPIVLQVPGQAPPTTIASYPRY